MAVGRSGISEGPPRLGDELPTVTPRVKCKLKHAESIVVPHYAVRQHSSKWLMTVAARADDERSYPFLEIESAVWCLRSKALVEVIVTRQDHIRPSYIEFLPNRST